MAVIPLDIVLGVVALIALFVWCVIVAVVDVIQVRIQAGEWGIWHALMPVLLLLAVVLGVIAAEIGLRGFGIINAR